MRGVTTPLGMPGMPPPTTDPPWRTAWDSALYGPDGFYRRHRPSEHFRTAVHDSALLAEALVALARRAGLTTLVDLGAGGGELAAAAARLAPDLQVVAVEIADRPAAMPAAVTWVPALPASLEGLVVAHEWLDTIPCHVVEVDAGGVPRLVHVDPATGRESLGLSVHDPGVPASIGAWLRSWWPLDGAAPGTRAEVGTARDRAWAGVVQRLSRGLAVAVDYGHRREHRPPRGSLRSYQRGRSVAVVPDGSRDVTADVAVDAVASATGALLRTQREVLTEIGPAAERPRLASASTDPRAYLTALDRAGHDAELRSPAGFGDFYWLLNGSGVEVLA